MNDPYTTLGVSRDASDAEIKKAYRELVSKYHPDKYVDNPLADLAQEKMKEINEAYDTITKMRSGSGSSGYARTGSGAGYSGASSASSGSTVFSEIRSAINSGNLGRAEQLLGTVQTRNAEWNFLMGSLCYKRGWLDEARQYYSVAANMDPTNGEYREALGYVNAGGYPYARSGFGMPANVNTDMCDVCTAMMCMNMLCRCR